MRYYLDTEFDSHNGPLLSLALVPDAGDSIHIRTTDRATNPWVIANVEPLMDKHDATISSSVTPTLVGVTIASYFSTMRDTSPVIVADSVVDIGRFCRALSTGMDGGWASVDYPVMRFEVHDVAAYPTDLPGAVQHNAWWDAMALRHKLGGDGDARCFACDAPFRIGDLVLDDASGGTLHAACCGPERDSYTDGNGDPLGPDAPIPTGYPWRP